jgi:integrase
MSKLKLTATAVKKLPAPDPSGRQVLYWDSDLKGFAVLCSGKTNSKTYIVQRDLPAKKGEQHGKTRRVTVASVNEVALDVARERAADILDNLRRGLDPKEKKSRVGTLRETFELYLAKRTLREPTRRVYGVAVRRYLAPFADMQLSDITPDMVEERFQAIPKEATRGDGLIAANLAMRVLRLLWTFAQERNPDLGANPVKRLKRLWNPEPRRKGLVRDKDMPKFYAAIQAWPNPVARDLLTLLLFTGLRKTEAASLTWDDINLQGRSIHIPATRTKNKRDFDLPMSDIVHDMFVSRRALGDAKYVFPSNSKAGFIADPGHPLERIAATCGLKVSVHDMRRTYASTAGATPDITLAQLKNLLNHSSGDVTEGYQVFAVNELRGPAQLIADRMKELCGIKPIAGNIEKISKGRK